MADVHDKATRSYNMSRIKGKNTKPELLVRRFLHSKGFRYKLHDKSLPGKPDIVLPKYRIAIFGSWPLLALTCEMFFAKVTTGKVKLLPQYQ